jgi:nitrite reductase/ring-hydroxylating ferredoxin subunit
MTRALPTEVAVYRRKVGASLERVWENVLDWEHLPWLHRSSFASIEPISAGAGGWRARVGVILGVQTSVAEIELRTEPERGRYVTATLDGVGAGSEIWTELEVVAPHETAIEVSFRVPDVPAAQVDLVGSYYRDLYRGLWDEDEAMMQHREKMLGISSRPPAAARCDVGSREEVLRRAPFVVEVGGRTYRVVAIEGRIFAHSTICPHALGPLEIDGGEGEVRCPWHGYAFDVRSGRSCDGRALRIPFAPSIGVDDGRVILTVGDSKPS